LIVGTDNFLSKTKEIFLKDGICNEIQSLNKPIEKEEKKEEKEETKSKKTFDLDKDFPKLKRV